MKNNLNNNVKLPFSLNQENKEKSVSKEAFDELVYIVTKSICSSRLVDFALRLIKDEDFRPLHKSPFPSLALINLMMTQNRYSDVINLMERNIQLFQLIESSNSQFVLHHHLNLICEALLLEGDQEAFGKLKKFFEIINVRRWKINNLGAICKINFRKTLMSNI